MSKTPFSKKCEILGTFWLLYRDDDAKADSWYDFFAWSDVGLPMAYMLWQDTVSVKPNGKVFVEEVWTAYCNLLGIDPNARYASMGETWDASPASISNE